jgi:radical SAM superfamily enzyme YgiQ (UPF0313 family)
MELPQRPKDDLFTTPGRYRELQERIRTRTAGDETAVLFVNAFDRRTRIGPFLFVDMKLIPGAPRAIASALHAAGLARTRVVLQQWNPHLRPSEARIDGRVPGLLLVSSMQIHSASAYRLIDDAWELGDDRPLIIAGGAKAAYEPWDFFGHGPDGRRGADVVVTGEEFVLLELLDRILEYKSDQEPWRAAFEKARAAGALADIPGLVYSRDPAGGTPGELVDTGPQRLVQDLDELPLPFAALDLFEPPHKEPTLAPHALGSDELKRHAGVLALVMTHGCRFHCSYCPIHAYNQGTFRFRSPARLVEEVAGMVERTGISNFFSTDDNFFNNREAAAAILAAMAGATVGGKSFRDAVWIGTEATEHDVDRNSDLIPLARDAGVRAIWFGIEDMTAELVKKGQSAQKTRDVFRLLLRHDIAPMAMMMHFDGQPLWSWVGLSGLVNQIRFLKRIGAISVMVTMLTPSVGSKGYEQPYRDGLVIGRVGRLPVADRHYDGNHIVATASRFPWMKQINILVAYAAFYNPLAALRALVKVDRFWKFRLAYQFLGHMGIAKSAWTAAGYMRRLVTGPVERLRDAPVPKFPLVPPTRLDAQGAR